MALDVLWKLDPVSPTSNSNYASANIAENCAPSGINNALRALGSFVAQQLCYQSAAISASVSTNIATTSTGLLVPIVGSGAVNSLGVVPGEQPSAAVVRFLQFSSSASLSNGTALRLLGGASRKTQPGDIGGYVHVGSSDVWHEFLYSRADGALSADSISVTTITNRSMSTSAVSTVTLNAASASITTIGISVLNSLTSVSSSVGSFGILKSSGLIVQVVRDTEAGYLDNQTDLPCDNTIPQNTEGDEILSVTITPKNSTSILRITFDGIVGVSTAGLVGAALFVDSTAAALNATSVRVPSTAGTTPIRLVHTVSAASTSARTYKIRLGPDASSPVSAFLNGDNTGRLMGGVSVARLEVEEIFA
jgi:hypothetical protein